MLQRRTLLASAAPLLAAPALAQSLTRVQLRLKWLPQTQFAGFYLALERGHYRAEGLDLTINPGGPNIQGETIVASGAEQFGVTGGIDSFFAARERQLPVVCIGMNHQITPFVFVAKRASNINSLEDFRGKRVTAWFTGAHLVLYGMLGARGITRESVNIQPQQVSVTPFINGETDVCAATWYNELNTIRARLGGDANLRLFSAEDYGISIPRDTLVANQAFAQSNPRAVEGFLRASIKGWREAKAEPAAGLESVMKIAPTLDRAHQIAMLPEAIRLMQAGPAATQGWFALDAGVIQRAHDFFVEQRVLQAPLDLAAAFRPEFLQAIPLPERMA
ncbi:MAG: ABC transporter substrate-binding protein [Rhodospirillales bacterium]|jgi:NitT/TauT family transport system substrate-binding protein|nr:ABC transporter substrate-binding protein [Rhodospirillales bacterium]